MSSSPELTPMFLFMSSETSSILATCREPRRKSLDQEVCWPRVNLALGEKEIQYMGTLWLSMEYAWISLSDSV